MRVIRGKRQTDRAQVQHGINSTKQMVRWNVALNTKLVKQLRRLVLSSHHRIFSRLLKTRTIESTI